MKSKIKLFYPILALVLICSYTYLPLWGFLRFKILYYRNACLRYRSNSRCHPPLSDR